MIQLIAWTDGILNGDFRSVGYQVPFVALTGETWPADHTVLLQIMSSVGATAFSTGYVLSPASAMGAGARFGSKNAWATLFDSFRQQIEKTGLMFRAQYYIGTKAEQWLAKAYGPRQDFLDEYYDPTRHELLRAYTGRIFGVHEDMAELDIDWDYAYRLSLSSTN